MALPILLSSCLKDQIYGGATIDEVKNTVAYTANDAVKVTAKVSALVPVKEVNLVWNTASQAETTVSMVPDNNGSWLGIIPAQPLDTKVSYYVVAETETYKVTSSVISYTVGATPINYSGLKLSELNGNDKYIELVNNGTEAIPLDGVYIEKDGKKNWPREAFPMPAGSSIAPGEFIVLYSSEKLDKIPEGWKDELQFDSGLSASKAVRVQILDPSGNNIDDFNLKDFKKAAPAAYSRNKDGKWYFAEGTPGAPNAEGTEAVEGLVEGDTPEEPEEPEEPEQPSGSQIEAGQIFINECDATNKQFEIYNATGSEINLAKLKIVKDGTDEWIVPDEGFKVAAKGFVVIPVKSDGVAGPIFGMSETKGFIIELISDKGSVHKADNSAKIDLTGKTFGLRADGGSEWVVFSTGSIGESNSKGIVEGEEPIEGEAMVVLNEINGNDKYIELFNAGEAEADLTGYQIKKDGEVKWTASDASQTKLAKGAYLKLDCVKKSTDPKEVASGISAKANVQVILLDKDGNEVDKFERGVEGTAWGDITLPENTEASFSRVPNGSGSWAYATPTPGAENGEKTGEIEQNDCAIVINEIDGNSKIIELFNIGTSGSISLNGYTLFKDAGESAIWTGADITLDAGEYLVLYSSKNTDNPDGAQIFNGGISAKKSVQIVLMDAAGNEISKFERGVEGTAWGDITLPENTEASFSRVPNGTGDWAYAAPTPGAENGEKTGNIEQQ